MDIQTTLCGRFERWAGYPDLFLTLTCNPKWPEIERFLSEQNLKPEDRPDIVTRIFKTKVDILIDDFERNRFFGESVSVVYTIEFQKRGLPHAHILLWLGKNNKFPTPDLIDKVISAEIPDESVDPDYYVVVRDLMVHGPCGHLNPKSPCMHDSMCGKHFPKKFVDATTVDSDGFPVYRRRDNGRTMVKNGIPIDNRWIVPHNRDLLLKYGAHINIEWCNQSRSIKYLFKYINKGHDRVTATFYRKASDDQADKKIDEIELYYDCRYLSPCEAAWRIFRYKIQYKNPTVERLSFHLPDQQVVVFSDNDSLEAVVRRPFVRDSMFLGWFTANVDYEEARKLTYVELPQKFVWKADFKKWELRKRGRAIGRLYYVPSGAGEAYYLRLLLNIQKNCWSFKDIRTLETGEEYATFRDACYVLGLLDDDKEYIDAIIEASSWASEHELRVLFATLLSLDCISRPTPLHRK